jgi:hypothetical protein
MIDSDFVVVDSAGWVEYFADGPKAASFARYLDKPEFVLLPTTVIYEVYKKLLRESTSDPARHSDCGACCSSELGNEAGDGRRDHLRIRPATSRDAHHVGRALRRAAMGRNDLSGACGVALTMLVVAFKLVVYHFG